MKFNIYHIVHTEMTIDNEATLFDSEEMPNDSKEMPIGNEEKSSGGK